MVARLTVSPRGNIGPIPLALFMVDLHPGLTIAGGVGARFRVEYTEDVTQTTGWQFLDDVILEEPISFFADRTPAREQRRFYRAIPQ